jgi:hypothetical protein
LYVLERKFSFIETMDIAIFRGRVHLFGERFRKIPGGAGKGVNWIYVFVYLVTRR